MNSSHTHTVVRLAVATLALFALIGCGLAPPSPSISSAASNVSSVASGGTVYVTVRGSTVGGAFSAFEDYSGTVSITGDGATASNRSVDGTELGDTFQVDVPVKLETQGSIELQVVLSAGGSTATRAVTVTVNPQRAAEGTTSNPFRLSMGTTHSAKVGTGTQRSSYYRFTPDTTEVTVTLSSYSASQDLDLYLYTGNTFTTVRTSDLSTSFSGETWKPSVTFTPGANEYLRVYNFSNSQNVTFSLRAQ